jgi:hypothetical protein
MFSIRAVTALWLTAGALGCGSRTPFNVIPSSTGDDEDDEALDASRDRDASVRADALGDRSLDGRADGDVSRDGDVNLDRADNADVPELPPCHAESRQGKGIPIDFYFVVDKSNSMANDAGMKSRWTAMSNALSVFVRAPESAGLGAGVAFFPRSSTGTNTLCNANDYRTPDVAIGLLPGVAPQITSSLAGQALGPGTPTTPALEGTLSYARAEKLSRVTRDVAVVLVTDGQPTQCSSTPTNSAAVIRNYATGSPPVRTYVLGIGPSVANLNILAQAGGTAPARLIESGGENELLDAFNAIRDNTITCDYQIPTKPGETLDYSLVSIQVRVGVNGMTAPVRKVDDPSGCGAQGGWFYDRPVPPGNPPPTKITLCPATCDPLMLTAGSHLDMLVGCKATP